MASSRIPGEPDMTSGSPVRDPRALRDPLMRFALLDEIARIADEPQWSEGDRNSIVLAKDRRFRMLLSVLRTGARVGDDDAAGTLSIQLVTGVARVSRGTDEVQLTPGELAVIEGGSSWSLEAAQDCAVLMTLAWPDAGER